MSENDLNRRRFLKTSALSLTALGLAQPPVFGSRSTTFPKSARRPPKSLPGFGRAKRCFFFNLSGGPSHLDLFDPKPDAPREIRGPFAPIRTVADGILLTELLPHTAQHADKVCFLRAVYHDAAPVHETSQELLLTGRIGIDGTQYPRIHEVLELLGTSRGEFDSPFQEFKLPDSKHRPWDIHGRAPYGDVNSYRSSDGISCSTVFDLMFGHLISTLNDDGSLHETLVVAAGEFGRTPHINVHGGRDHWQHCWSVLMAGGGVRGGQVIGASDRHGAYPVDRPVRCQEIAATIYHALGIDLQSQAPGPDGQPIPIVEPGVEPILELF